MDYIIKGTYQGNTEILDEFTDKLEAETCLAEYKIAYGNGWIIWIESN